MHSTAVRSLFLGGVFLAQIALPDVATAQTPRLPILFNPANGHYYQRISFGRRLTFDELLTRAASMSHLGIPGHLATITSQAEQDFLNQQITGLPYSCFIGASDAAVEGEWRWIAGPESGQLFWLGGKTGTAFGFQEWFFDEPNNYDVWDRVNGEDFAYMFFSGGNEQQPLRRAYWNDIAFGDTYGPNDALVEFSPLPEPSTASLGGYLLLAVAFGRRLRLLPTRRAGG